jgi:hypothetical protein
MRKDMYRCSLVAILLIVVSLDTWAQSAARQSDALLDLLLWGTDRSIHITAYTPEVNAELDKVLRRSQAYESQRREPVGSAGFEILLNTAQVRYERLLVAMADDSRAPALAVTYVNELRPCYEWEGYHDCPEREASFAIDYMKTNPDGPFTAYLPLLAAHRWLCTAEAYEYEKRPDAAVRSRRAYEDALSVALGSRAVLVRTAAQALQVRGTCRSQD